MVLGYAYSMIAELYLIGGIVLVIIGYLFWDIFVRESRKGYAATGHSRAACLLHIHLFYIVITQV